MRACLTRKNLILAASSALILFYFNPLALVAYLIIVCALVAVCHLGPANGAVKVSNFLVNTTILVVTFFCLAVLLEIGLYWQPHFFTGSQEQDTVGEFTDFTSRGYLTEAVFEKPKSVFRIMGLGDSFSVYAPENKDNLNYNVILKEKFATLRPGRVEIVNAGMPAVGPGYYWHILEKYGDRLKPDLVMVGFFIGNDFVEWEMFITIGHFISEPKDLKKKLWRYLDIRKSRLVKLLQRKYVWYTESRRQSQEAQKMIGGEVPTFSEEAFLKMERERGWIFEKQNQPALRHQWQQCANLLSQMKQWCDDRKIDLVVLVFPDQFQVDEDLRSQVMKNYHLAAESLDLGYPNSLIDGFCREKHLHCLDLLRPFQEQGKSQTLYALRDSHWNEAGNRLAADLIYRYLEEHQLIKAD